MILLYFKGPGEAKIEKISIKNRTWKNTKNSYVLLSKKTKNAKKLPPLAPPGGVRLLTFLMVFGIRPPSGAQDASRGSPGVPRAIPSTNFWWFWVDLGWILMWFGLLLGIPGSAQAIKLMSTFGQHSPCVGRVQGYQNLGSILPELQPPKWISKFKQPTVQRRTANPS